MADDAAQGADQQAGVGDVAPGRARLLTGAQLVVVALLLCASLAGAWQVHRVVRDHQRDRFDNAAERIDVALQERMKAYVQVLRGGLGLFRASDLVTREDWRVYVSTLRLGERYPGFKSLSYAPAVPAGGLPAFVRRVRAEPPPVGSGASGAQALRRYALRAPRGSGGTPAVHSPILYVAPFSAENRLVLGVDMMREPVRRASMERAARLGQAVLSPRLGLSGSRNAESGFIAYVPVPRPGGGTRGWLTAAFLTESFVRGLLEGQGSDLRYAIYDGTGTGRAALLHTTAGTGADGSPRPLTGVAGAAFRRTSRIALPGRRWTVQYAARPGFVPLQDRLAPWLVLLGGLLTTVLFAAVTAAGARWREQAGLLARQAEGLRRARAEAETAARARTAFLATMSHEIRTPMNAVIGMSSLLSESALDEEQQEQARIIRGSGEHLLHLINEILDFSKLEAGRVELEHLPFDLAGCVGSAIDLVSGAALAEDVRLESVVAPDVPAWVRGDVSRLRQVLLNLLANAVRFTPRGGRVRVEVAVDRAAGGDTLAFAVHDTGIGITEAQQARLFQAFTQAEPATARTHGGTGLGLSIAKHLVEAMDGSIGVTSVPGEGSTFRFTIRAPAAAPPPDDGGEHGAGDEDELTPRDLGTTHPLRVLVAEDHTVNQVVARRLLARLGYQADIVGNGAEVLAALDQRPYDVVFLDVQMPVMGGLEAAAALRDRLGPEPRPWLVAMTANVWPEDRQAARAAGMDGFVAKPITLLALAQALRAARPLDAVRDV